MNDEELLKRIVDAYEQTELKLLDKLQSLVLLGMTDDEAADTLLGKKLQQLRQLRQYTVQQLRSLAEMDSGMQAFLQGSAIAGEIQGGSSAALNNLTADYLRLLRDSRLQILRQIEDAYRRIVFESTQLATLGVDTRLQAARRALQKFAGEGVTAFVAKDGRQYDIRSYTEMATRTTLANARREGRLNNIPGDLIIINSIPNPSPLCAPYERKVLSVSGKSDKYPSLQSAKDNGLFHPNCRHSFTAYVPGLTKISAPEESDDYEATQEQRYLERQERAWKRRLAVADTPQAKQKAKDKITQYKERIKDVVDANDLVRKSNREGNISAR